MAGYNLPNISMKTEEQDANIRVAFYNEDTITKWTELQESIGKKIPNLVKPQNESLIHPAAGIIESYATEGWPGNCGPYWKKYHI